MAGSVAYDDTTHTATFTPSGPLSTGTSYTVSVSATATNGLAMTQAYQWSFTTGVPATCPCTLLGNAVPANASSGDSSDLELGVRFRSDEGGYVTGVRFYKGSGNTGVHTGTLWSATGTALATGTFTNETASGWQTLTFDAPVAVSAATDYVVSYHAPSGNWSYTSHFYDNGWDAPPLHAAAPNGVYRVGAGFPTSTANNTNYYVDVVFATTGAPSPPPPGPAPGPSLVPTTTRLAGADRYATSAAVSAATFAPGVSAVFVATGTDFPDALAGAAAAGHLKAPMLLVTPTTIPPVIAAELTRLAPQHIYVLGGTAAVSAALESQLAGYTTGTVQRLAGPNRYGTAAAVSRAFFNPGVADVFVATGLDFPDALAGSAAAGSQGIPVLLVAGSRIPAETAAELTRLRPQRITMLGGTGVISPAVAAQLAAYAPQTRRLAGPDRYSTAAAIAQAAFGSATQVWMASGAGFPDALSAGAAAATTGGPVLLSTSACVPLASSAEVTRLSAQKVVLVGGEGVLSSSIDGLTSCGG